MQSSVRKATKDDLLKVAMLYKKGLEEMGHIVIDDKVMNKVINSYHLAPCFLLVIDDKIVGIAGLTAVTAAWSNAVMLADYMFFIGKEYRSLENLSALTLACKDFAKDMKLPLRLEFVTGKKEVRERLFKMHGFDKTIVVGVFDGQ